MTDEPTTESRSRPGLSVRNLRAGYSVGTKYIPIHRTLVLDGIGFDVAPGEIVAFVGHNGSGKSTLIRSLTDENLRLGGDVLIDGGQLTTGQVAYVPQAASSSLSPWQTARAEIALSHRIRNRSRQSWSRVADQIVSDYSLHVPLDRHITELSGGQRVRVAILRALAVQDCRLFVLDEPTEGLDEDARATVLNIICEVAARGIPTIVTSHRSDDLELLQARQIRLTGMPVRNLSENGPLEKEATSSTPANRSPTGSNNASDDYTGNPHVVRGSRMLPIPWWGLIGVLIGIAIWTAIAALVRNSGLVPSPASVLGGLGDIFGDRSNVNRLLYTLGRGFGGWVVAVIFAIPAGLMLGYNSRLYNMAAPWLTVARCMPVFALTVLAQTTFPGRFELQRVALIGLTVFVIALQPVSAAAALSPRRRIDCARAFGASHRFCMVHILPYECAAGIVGTLEVTLPIAIIVTLVVETLLVPLVGLGVLITNHLQDRELSALAAILMVPAIITAVILVTIRFLSRRFRYEV